MKDIELGCGYRLHRRDRLNWELQEWREADQMQDKRTGVKLG